MFQLAYLFSLAFSLANAAAVLATKGIPSFDGTDGGSVVTGGGGGTSAADAHCIYEPDLEPKCAQRLVEGNSFLVGVFLSSRYLVQSVSVGS